MASRLLPRDMLRLATIGLRTRKLRAALSVLGISIGIASLVAVLAISETSKADLLATIEKLGTNLLTVGPGESLFGEETELPGAAAGRVRMLPEVESASSVTQVGGVTVRRSSYVPEEVTGGIAVRAAEDSLLTTLDGELRDGRFLDRASERYPAIVLGAKTAQRLGIERVEGVTQVYLSGRLFTVVGILEPLRLAPEIDSSALIGYPIAKQLFGTERSASQIYVRTLDGEADVNRAAALLPSAADPWDPDEVAVSRPSDALEAQAAAEGAFTSLFLGLGAVALLVGGIGIANVMIISVLERRSEVGLRRALGARRRHIATQFLSESFVLGILGGAAGVLLGAGATAAYAAFEGLELLVPPLAIGGGLLAACLLGGLAGLYPALRAARLTPTEALRSV
ncbi:MAG TPA: ABC transporter permease [Solirubrobacterales bacterium]|nr:ABC transporter permease [Solirubrobacterales bacterium]